MKVRKFFTSRFRTVLELFSILLLFISCATTKKVVYNIPSTLNEEGYVLSYPEFYNEDTERIFSNQDSYIFLRLYNPKYTVISSGAVLQAGLNTVDRNPFKGTHIAIGFDLTDNFYGLTLYADPNFKIEKCSDISTNEYMMTCDPKTSLQTTFAVKVTSEERQAIKMMVKEYLQQANLLYDVSRNFPIAADTIHRKVSITHKTQRTYKRALREQKMRDTFRVQSNPSKFVCSTVVGHILDTSVPKIHEYFIQNNLDFNFMTPSDMTQIPDSQPLFTSTWNEYIPTSLRFGKEHPEMARYLSKDSSLQAKN